MIPPVQSSPISTVTTPTTNAVAPAKLSIPPGEAQTRAAIEANFGGVISIPPPPTSPRNKAMAALEFGEKWAGDFSRIADLSGVDVGNALNFAHADVRRLVGDLSHHAPDATITRDTNRLLGDWAGRGGAHAFQALRHGMFLNVEGDVRAANRDLSRAGVTSPQVHSALHELNNVLRYVDSALSGRPGPFPFPLPTGGGAVGSPVGGPIGGAIGGPAGGIGQGAIGLPSGGLAGGGPLGGIVGGLGGPIGGIGGIGGGIGGPGQLQYLIDSAMQKATQAMMLDARAHPEHARAFQGAMTMISGSLRQMQMGVQVTRAMQQSILQDLSRLGSLPQPGPQPVPLPWPQPLPQPPKVPTTDAAPVDAQAA